MPEPRDILELLDPAAFRGIDDSVWALVTTLVDQNVTSTQYGTNFTYAQALWMGHFLTVLGLSSCVSTTDSGQSASNSAQISKMTVGQVSVEYATQAAAAESFGDAWLAQSKWGRMLAGLATQYVGLSMFVT